VSVPSNDIIIFSRNYTVYIVEVGFNHTVCCTKPGHIQYIVSIFVKTQGHAFLFINIIGEVISLGGLSLTDEMSEMGDEFKKIKY